MTIRSVQVISRISDEASGPTYSVVQLSMALREIECGTTVAVLRSPTDDPKYKFVKEFSLSRGPARLGRSRSMKRWLKGAARSGKVDIIHNHGLWMMPNVYAGQAVVGTKTPLVISPRGCFSNWALARSKWVKRAFWLAVQAKAVNVAACFHATAEHEYEDIRRAGFKQPVAVIPNGVGIPQSISKSKHRAGRRRLLFLGRIHPVKGIDLLLRAWALVAGRFPDWELEIIGPDNNDYGKEIHSLAHSLRLERVSFRGGVYGKDKSQAYQDADIYILPSHSENFGMTVAESLASGTPVITTHGTPWQGLKQHNAGWWIELSVDSLVACLDEALQCLPGELTAKGHAGREWMKADYSWQVVAAKMEKTYVWLLHGGEVPAWVKCD